VDVHQKSRAEADRNYERELLNHAKDVELLTSTKDELGVKSRALEEAQSAHANHVADLTSSEASWTEQKKALTEQLSRATSSVENKEQMNKLLHTQLETLGVQVQKMQDDKANAAMAGGDTAPPAAAAADGEAAMVPASLVAERDQSLGQMREVLKYIRREKEMVECRLETVEQEKVPSARSSSRSSARQIHSSLSCSSSWTRAMAAAVGAKRNTRNC